MDTDFLQYGGQAMNLPGIVMLVGLLLAVIVEVVGLFYFTQLTFGNFQPTKTKVMIMKITIVLMWLGVLFKVLSGVGFLSM